MYEAVHMSMTTDEKLELILWKLSSIQMKILNDIASNLKWIKFIKFELNWGEMGYKLVYKVLKIYLMTMVEKQNFEKTYIRENTFPFIWELAKQIPISNFPKSCWNSNCPT